MPAPAALEYDSLIVAGGSRYSYFGHDDWQAHAPELKSLEGALDIRSRILTALEAAEWEPDAERRRAWLTFVVVGAGPTGVEMAGQIAEIAHDSVRDFRACRHRERACPARRGGRPRADRLSAVALGERRARAAEARRDTAARAHGHRHRRATR